MVQTLGITKIEIRRFQNDFGPIHVRAQWDSLFCYCDFIELNGIVTSLLT